MKILICSFLLIFGGMTLYSQSKANHEDLSLLFREGFEQEPISLALDDCKLLDGIRLNSNNSLGIAGSVSFDGKQAVFSPFPLEDPSEQLFCKFTPKSFMRVTVTIKGLHWTFEWDPHKGLVLEIAKNQDGIVFVQRNETPLLD